MLAQLRKLLQLLDRRDLRQLGIVFCLMLLASAAQVVSLGSVPVAITLISDPARLENTIIVGELAASLKSLPRSRLILLVGASYLLVMVVNLVIGFLSRYAQVKFATARQARLATRLFEKYMKAPYLYHLGADSSGLIRNIQVGASRMGGQVISLVLNASQNLLTLVGTLILLAVAMPLVTFLSILVVVAVGAIFIRLTTKRARALGRLEIGHRKESLKMMRQAFRGIKEIRMFGVSSYFIDGFDKNMRRIADIQRSGQLLSFLSAPLMEFLSITALIAVTFMLIVTRQNLTSTLALLGLFGMAFLRIRGSVNALLGTYSRLTYNLPTVDLVYDDIAGLEDAEAGACADANFSSPPLVRFERVSFAYPGAAEKVLEDVSLEIAPGAYVGLAGATGAGKSTLVGVLTGLLPAVSGRVLVDGEDINVNLGRWQRSIGYVPQDMFLIDDTIARNVALGIRDEEIEYGRLWEALQRANLKAFVESLPQGLETTVGERGVRLSGGQKQRVSIARALYRRPVVLILDEATASLDHETEQAFLTAIDTLRGNLTIVSIAHRLTSLSHCDELYEVSGAGLTMRSYRELENRTRKNPIPAESG
jgi:ATP-binding cassette subfamily C protein